VDDAEGCCLALTTEIHRTGLVPTPESRQVSGADVLCAGAGDSAGTRSRRPRMSRSNFGAFGFRLDRAALTIGDVNLADACRGAQYHRQTPPLGNFKRRQQESYASANPRFEASAHRGDGITAVVLLRSGLTPCREIAGKMTTSPPETPV